MFVTPEFSLDMVISIKILTSFTHHKDMDKNSAFMSDFFGHVVIWEFFIRWFTAIFMMFVDFWTGHISSSKQLLGRTSASMIVRGRFDSIAGSED